EPRHRSRGLERGRRAVPAPQRARRRARHAARAQPLPVHRHAPRAFRRPHPRRAARGARRARRLAVLGRGRRPLLRHDLPGSRLFQRHPRQPVHRRSDAQAPGLRGDAQRKRAQRDRRAASQRSGSDANARGRRVRLRRLHRHLRRRPDDDRAHRPGPLDRRGALRHGDPDRFDRRRTRADRHGPTLRLPLLLRPARGGGGRRGHRPTGGRPARRRAGRHGLERGAVSVRRDDGRMLTEINFDGLVGPSHNYAGLSLGNLAATAHAGDVSYPRAAALQGLAKMRGNMALGLAQGFFVPLPRPDRRWLDELAADATTDRALLAGAWSASSMWTANAATVSPAPDTADRRCHLTAANLVTMPHRAHEWPDTLRQLELIFADKRHFAVHAPVPPCFGDVGAANHMRLTAAHGEPGLEIFVYGKRGGPFPARQHEQASRIVARRHRLDPERVLFLEQSPEAIAAGAFHNDVVAVANERVLFAHERAFADPQAAHAAIRERFPKVEIVQVPDSAVSLAEAIRTYLFNAQLVTLPEGAMALVIPSEADESPAVRSWLDAMLATNGP